MSEKKLFLLDAYALIFRAYYAFIRNPRVTTKGLNTSAIFGFTNTLDELLRKEDPAYIGVVFDPPGPNFRHEMYEEYKANRDATPEDIKLAVPYIKQILDAYRIPVIEVSGFEADDVIGTLANKAAQDGFDVFMMTPDKDFGQLVHDNIKMYKPAKSGNDAEVWGVNEVKERFDLSDPKQVIDILALMGDAADNIPGCPGIGEKTAMKLISQFGSVDGIYENLEQLKGKQKENLENFKEQVYLSRDLAIIKTDVPVNFDPDGLKKEDFDRQKLAELFEELEFRTMKNRIIGDVQKDPVQGTLFGSDDTEVNVSVDMPETGRENILTRKHEYILVDDAMKRASLRAELATKKEFCFDTETTGLDPLEAELVGMAFSYADRQAFYVPVPADQSDATKLVQEFKAVFTDSKILKIGQNIKYDILVMHKYGIEIKGPVFDTMIAHYLIQPELKHNLDELAIQYLNYDTVKTEELIGKKGKNQLSMRDVKVEEVKDYAGEDAEVTYRLKPFLEKGLKDEKITSLFYDLEMPLLKVLVKMEVAGVKLDVDALKSYSLQLNEMIEKLEKEIIEMAGMEFNVSSPKQVGEVLFEHLKIDDKAKKTKSGQYSTSEDVLVKLRNRHEIVDKILDYRGLKKLLNTYVDALPELINSRTGKIHTSFNQAIAATGRLSSTNPNLQNIPIRDEAGRELRKAFVASDADHLFFSADYSQVELRLMAHMSEDKNMLGAFNQGEDIHAATAAKIYGISLSDVDSDMRRKAKTANFGIIYGISAFGLSERLNIPRSEAKQLIDGYFETYPQIKAFMDSSIKDARDKGFVTTILGRRRYLPDINSRNGMIRGMAERNAINAPIQGSAADIIKLAMVKIQERFDEENLQSKMVLQVHDELNFDVLKSELDTVKNIVVQEMENAYTLNVPLTVDCGSGANWLEAH
ncbi:DNA polymerase I [Saccharicrinis sp. FJH62]|uniref:DNA polymerase I n=1 Tax=Saccharicrinis sp. FJH62 TaxID=3344657 RepID=UPI0035D50124